MCEQQFTSKFELNEHTRNHEANKSPKFRCPVCDWEFDDSLQLDRHQTASEHHTLLYSCETCKKGFVTQRGLEHHMKPPSSCSSNDSGASSSQQARHSVPQAVGPVFCDRCSNAFVTQKDYDKHRSYKTNGPCADHKKKFRSTTPVRAGYKDAENPDDAIEKVLEYTTSSDDSETPSNMSDDAWWCGQCKTRFDSQAHFNLHALACTTKHGSYANAPQKVTEDLQDISTPVRKGKPMSRATSHPVPSPIPAFATPFLAAPAQIRHTPHQSPLAYAPVQMQMASPIGDNMGGAFEKEQAKEIQGKILRLLIQSDIFIHHDGIFEVGDLKFTRVPMAKQSEVAASLDSMCHLPKILQGEYLPRPKAFSSETKTSYPSSEFESSPPRNAAKPGLAVVALACSKIILADGLQEVVKIAAIDVVTCRILMNHLVCTNPAARVANWKTNETGMFGWEDMEEARNQGYRIFKGWYAARAALWKFVDKNTIIVGHNLRSDLDCLRMVHGRAVDIAKVAEKAANGPLSTKQLGLYSLCRDFPNVMLKTDGEYGCDVLLEAFAVREMGLWIIKNKDAFQRKLRQNSLDYQAIHPVAAAA
ncbi:hypothetical protein IQ06DRAFT_226508 [Phaeosphaeriaceae sp. SRC1lsM3a]|nr:hypothetical protein IQ06DRAFT_226508 [Stagonospora sp. SRC1lsM3a]